MAIVMDREQIDNALSHLQDERDRISAALLDLDSHMGYRLLEKAELTGSTKEKGAAAIAGITALWRLFDAYNLTLNRAVHDREASEDPGDTERQALTELLTGKSVAVPRGEVPIEKRGLLDPEVASVSLHAAVKEMTELYERWIPEVAAIDRVWSELTPRLNGAEATFGRIRSLQENLGGGHPDFARVEGELAEVGSTVRHDPLALADSAESLDLVVAEVARLLDDLQHAARIRDDFERRTTEIRTGIAHVKEKEAGAVELRDRVRSRVDTPARLSVPHPSPELENELAMLDPLRAAERWTELAAKTNALERSVQSALTDLDAYLENIGGLLARRNELRGMLHAYQAKAARLGYAEDERLQRMYDEAHRLLWTAPCDLRAATRLVREYQLAIVGG